MEPKENPLILVVDDDAAIAKLVQDVLAEADMNVLACHATREALELVRERKIDLALLDIMMPGMDGLELCAQIRQFSDVPIVFLTAKDGEGDLVVGLSLGADDYIVKPFRPRELVARIRARLRKTTANASSTVVTRDFMIDKTRHVAYLRDQELSLTPKEFEILLALAQHAGAPVAARDLFEHAWQEPYDASAANTVMVHIRHLRQKCAALDSSQSFIDTVWGVGYKLNEPTKAQST